VTDTATPTGTTPTAPAQPRRWVRYLLATVVLGIVVMWVYAFVFAPREGVYRVSDDAWRTSAEAICAAAETERMQLADTGGGYIGDPTLEQMRQRAAIVDEATDVVEQMLDDVVALPLAGEKDRLRVAVFDEHYRMLLADRRAYAADLRAGDNRPFHESVVDGGPVTNVLTDFTSGNGIKSCAPPGEL
jgi:hypothetical protein